MPIESDIVGFVPDLKRFRPFCKANDIPVSTGYRLATEGKIRVVKLDGRSYVDMNDWRERV